MHSAYHTLRAVALNLSQRLPGRLIEQVYSQDRDEVVFAFMGLAEQLVVSCRSDLCCCYLHSALARAKKNSANVLPASIGRKIYEVTIHPADRVVTMYLSGGGRISMELFGARSNVLLIGEHATIEGAFKRSRELAGQVHTPPPLTASLSPEGLAKAISTLGQSSFGAAIKRFSPQFPPIVIRELLSRAGLSPEMPVALMTADRAPALIAAISSVVNDLATPQPRIYSLHIGSPLHFSIIPLTVLGECREDRFEDIHKALQSFVAWKRSAANITDERRALEHRFQSTLDHAQRVVRAIDADLAAGDRAEQYQQYGSLILQHLSSIVPGSARVALSGENGEIVVPLVPTQTPSQNAQRYFEKAKTSRRARDLAVRRRAVYGGRMERSAMLLSELDRITTRQELKTFMERHHNDLHSPKEDSPSDDQDRPLFRVFVVEGGFEVWAGRSSANNDVLTLRHAKPQDFWFHARGVSGSHVILRVATGRGEPGKRALRQAASIAAYYSKMRTASLVPVAVTRRKYVHKPRGAPAGSVVLQREDVIMVEPQLPHPIEENDE
jgi:predicted ribosome quality control (RQC) complex YloA/Tae2 family protein